MPSAKDLRIAPIASTDARAFIREHHYSGKVASNSQLHLGAFIGPRLVGVAQFGPPLDRGKLLGLVKGTPWNGMLELNRLALIEDTPRNSESRFLAVCMRLIRQRAPHVQWVVSFADGTQCGDGTIYRASGFVLTAIKRSDNLAKLPSGETIHKMTLESSPTAPRHELGGRTYYQATGGKYNFAAYVAESGAKVLPGFQLRYIYFLEPTARDRLTVPVLPFSAIDDAGAGMYLGKPRASEASSDAPTVQVGEGGAAPTPALHTTRRR